METPPSEKRFELAPFAIHATRGLLRTPRARRKTMAVLVAVALIMVAVGLFGLRPWLEPHEHPVRFILFWFACGWVTLTILLLAVLDLLLVRAEGRRAEQVLREEAAGNPPTTPPE
jgi:biopolymer transport protein ExbB/TolQ